MLEHAVYGPSGMCSKYLKGIGPVPVTTCFGFCVELSRFHALVNVLVPKAFLGCFWAHRSNYSHLCLDWRTFLKVTALGVRHKNATSTTGHNHKEKKTKSNNKKTTNNAAYNTNNKTTTTAKKKKQVV